MNIRKDIPKALAAQDFSVVEACFNENAALTSRILQMHVYGHPHELVRWSAIDALGRLAERYAEENDDLFRNIIRRFIWQMCEESANVPWASAEVCGSIIAGVPGKQFEEFIGPLFYHAGLNDICYAGLYWALPKLMGYHAKKVEEYLPQTYSWFEQYDMADMRAYAAIYFSAYPHDEMVSLLNHWLEDTRTVALYMNRQIQEHSVCELAQAALK